MKEQKLTGTRPYRETPTRLKRDEAAFTRIELLAASVALLLIVLVMSPALASNRTDSERLVCFNNLRLIGRAVQMWAGDHDGQTPWRTLVSDGGLKPNSGLRPANAFIDYYFLSNQLATPTILACPSDAGVKKAINYGEFISVSYRNQAVSYFIGLESTADAPRSLVSGDRNINFAAGGACSAGVSFIHGIQTVGNSSANYRWTNAVHGQFGHILLMDGSVEFTSPPRLTTLILSAKADDNGSIHFLPAR